MFRGLSRIFPNYVTVQRFTVKGLKTAVHILNEHKLGKTLSKEQSNYFNNNNNYNNKILLLLINLIYNYSCLYIKLNRDSLLIYISNKCYLVICIICNPPFNQCVSNNIAKVFLKLLDKHSLKSNILHKIFNRNSVKVRYSCTQNISQIISNHNMSILNSRTENCLPCNCQKKEECPLDGKCRSKDVIYECVASTPNAPNKNFYCVISIVKISLFVNDIL